MNWTDAICYVILTVVAAMVALGAVWVFKGLFF